MPPAKKPLKAPTKPKPEPTPVLPLAFAILTSADLGAAEGTEGSAFCQLVWGENLDAVGLQASKLAEPDELIYACYVDARMMISSMQTSLQNSRSEGVDGVESGE